MLNFPNGGRLVQSTNELPQLLNAATLYLDFETTSGDKKLDSLNPWFNCEVAGAAITVDDTLGAWYVPCDVLDAAPAWLADIIATAGRWANHHVKYDVHVALNSLGIRAACPLVCTIVGAKIINSDRLQYGLDRLSRDWLHEDISQHEMALMPYLHKNKDYGMIPPDIIAPYACQDVLTNRRLLKYEEQLCHPECRSVWNTEIELTSVLVDMERAGLRVDPTELRARELLLMYQLLEIEEKLARIVGRPFQPHVNDDVYQVLCGQYGLPILAWTEGDEDDPETERGGPSFDKEALAAYLNHPDAPKDVLKLIVDYRKLNTLNNFFVKPYQVLQRNGVMHPEHNQCVRTGRLSAKKPNPQQLDKRAKALIHPDKGCSLLSVDFSQIEFRFIVHYTKNEMATHAFLENPDTDFHEWVGKICGMKRDPAKTVNFAIAFGMGKKKTQRSLAMNSDVMGDLVARVDRAVFEGRLNMKHRAQALEAACVKKAASVYDEYHRTFPEIKHTAKSAENVARSRGYVRNLYGRHRHLPRERAHIAFNTLNQSSAADLQKERTVALAAMLREKYPEVGLRATVHDETLMHGPSGLMSNTSLHRDVAEVMERPSIPLRVPVRVKFGLSAISWADTGKKEHQFLMPYTPKLENGVHACVTCVKVQNDPTSPDSSVAELEVGPPTQKPSRGSDSTIEPVGDRGSC